MAFNVEISPRAFQDLDELAMNIRQRSRSFHIARGWFLSILKCIDSLTKMPERCPVVVEAELECDRVRLLLHGVRNRRYKIYYSVLRNSPSSGTVSVFHVRHWARKPLSQDEIEELIDELHGEEEEL